MYVPSFSLRVELSMKQVCRGSTDPNMRLPIIKTKNKELCISGWDSNVFLHYARIAVGIVLDSILLYPLYFIRKRALTCTIKSMPLLPLVMECNFKALF